MRHQHAITLTVALFMVSQTLGAQHFRDIPLRAFETDTEATAFLMLQSKNWLAEVHRRAETSRCGQSANSGRPNGDSVKPSRNTVCLGVIPDRVWLDDSDLIIHPSTRQLMMADSSIRPLRLAGAIQRAGTDLFIMRRGQLARVQWSGGPPRTTAVVSPRIAETAWPNEWSDEVMVWGNVVATFHHGQGSAYPTLRTFVTHADGTLTPRDTLIVFGEPQTRQHNLATRLLGSRLLLYVAAPVAAELDVPLSFLVAIAPRMPDGSRIAPLEYMTPLRRVYRPVAVFDSTAVLNFAHTLIDCDLATARLTCHATLVLAPETRRYTFTESALEIVATAGNTTAVRGSPQLPGDATPHDGALFVRIPYAGSLPTASVAADPHPTVHTLAVGPRTIARTVAAPSAREDTSVQLSDTVTVTHTTSGQQWRIPLSHHVERMVELGESVLLIGPARGHVQASLLQLHNTPRIAQILTLPQARDKRSNAVLTVHRVGARTVNHYRVGYTVAEVDTDSTRNPFDAYNAVWFLDVHADSMSSLGVLRASPATFSKGADVDIALQRLGATQAVIVGDRLLAVFHEELVEGRVVNGRVVEVGRTLLLPE